MTPSLSSYVHPAVGLALATAVLAAVVLPRLASRLGWVDAARGAERSRKLQSQPVPAVGGAICLAGALAGWALLVARGGAVEALVPGRGLESWLAGVLGGDAPLWPLGGMLAAFAVGLADDLVPGGLRPAWKLAGQMASGACLGAPLLWNPALAPPVALLAVLLIALGAAVAQNAINTFDNADGAAGALALAALAWPAPLLAAPLLVFLPANLRRRRAGVPHAFLGDSGSHLVGMGFLLTPAAWPVLVLPLADLARLAVVRTRVGSAPWVGDRRHLAHRLQRRGVPRLALPLLLVAIAAPTAVLGWAGAVPTLALLVCALAWAGGASGSRRDLGADEPTKGG